MPSCCFLVMVASAYCYNTWQSETLTNDWFDKRQPNYTADCVCNNLKQYMNMISALGGLVWERVRIQNGDRQLLARKPKHNIWGSTAGPCQSAQHKAPSVGKHAVGAAEGVARDASPGTHARGVFGAWSGSRVRMGVCQQRPGFGTKESWDNIVYVTASDAFFPAYIYICVLLKFIFVFM